MSRFTAWMLVDFVDEDGYYELTELAIRPNHSAVLPMASVCEGS
jgi:hypothetical protein